MKYIVSWSGGKDSTDMLYELAERGYPIDEVVRCNTTIEFPAIEEHCAQVQEYFSKVYPSIKFTTLEPEHDFEYYLLAYEKQRGLNAGQCGLGCPNPNYIWCRKYLKLDVIDKYLDSKYGKGNYIIYIGIAFDEYDRYPDMTYDCKVYPLIAFRRTELMALKSCWNRGLYSNYNTPELYDLHFRCSCYCCPLQSIKDLYMLYQFHRDLFDKMESYDKLQNNRFRKDYSFKELRLMFEQLNSKSFALDEKFFEFTKVSEPYNKEQNKGG